MAVQCLLPLRLYPDDFFSTHRTTTLLFHSHFTKRDKNRSFPFSRICATSPYSSSSWEKEEARWLREEQRWVREEQRWLREESRWNSERESLLREIANLRIHIQHLERHRTPSTPVSNDDIDVVLRKTTPPLVLAEEADVKEMILEEVRVESRVEEVEKPDEKVMETKGKRNTEKRTLRVGSEGDDVREMQVGVKEMQSPFHFFTTTVMPKALEKLGFYSGEEDMEFSSFASGTERAVKTWQASVGIREDGIMSSELLEKLLTGAFESDEDNNKLPQIKKGNENGALFVSVTEIAQIQQTSVKENGNREVETFEHRVFLLGENRWEDPRRLVSKEKPASQSNATSSVKCLTCRGEGRLMCTECDGTGEPNIEPQFLEWVGEDTKCPYCEGLGYTICDLCEGKTFVENQSSV